ncbi:TetR/AcrR family transcriptional regulator [Streptomonospora sp. S1-112]|uniref:TetR/AcrR family transcriptional regulator n=1 Tax=Streptomonospora mangrovi TaxID=2883123 RepID=A0A9X3SIE4_9ACTN|nr:TetR/AcrR family transcriptional regulator [Streptomonospora mangrovi]MDA0566174.1 TetR/AcrR family transcriptional regulator [Streptomonospora mangrovi]
MAEEDVPPGLGRLWRLPTAAPTGRPAELGVERIVDAAVRLADREGLGAVTLARVAKELGYTAMSLYRHVGSKDELFVLMGDAAQGPPPDVPGGSTDWREGVRRWAAALAELAARRPWLAELPVQGPPSGPNAVAWLDAGLRTLRDTGLDWGQKVGIVLVVSSYVRQAGSMARQMEEGRRASGRDQAQVERDYGRALARLVDPGRFPDAAALFASGVFEAPPEPLEGGPPVDHDFVFGLELILDGVAATIAAAQARSAPAGPSPVQAPGARVTNVPGQHIQAPP